jgi:hypothetical protein
MVNPKARVQGLLTEQLGDELVVYDQERKRGHRLNRTSALVWRYSDGTKTIREIAALLQQELNPAADENLVLITLSQLDAAHLLEESVKVSSQQTRSSRREFVRKVGAIGVVSLILPLITTMSVPSPAGAQTCTQSAGQCSTTCSPCELSSSFCGSLICLSSGTCNACICCGSGFCGSAA